MSAPTAQSEPGSRARDCDSDPTLEHTSRLLRQLVEGRIVGASAQIVVHYRGMPVGAFACGRNASGLPATVDSVFWSYCALKPIVGLRWLAATDGAATAALDAEVTPEVLYRLTDPPPASRRALTWGELLDHTAGLERPLILNALSAPSASLEALVEERTAEALTRPAEPRLSEVSTWLFVARSLSDQLGDPCVTRSTEAAIRDQLGMARTTFGGIPHYYDEYRDEICLPSWDGRSGLVPMLHGLAPAMVDRSSIALGAYTSAADVARYWAALNAVLDPRSRTLHAGGSGSLFPERDALRVALARPPAPALETLVQEKGRYAAGVMVDLSGHGFGARPSSSAVAHHGGGASVVGLADPEHGVSFGAFVARFWLDRDDRQQFLTALTDAVYEDVLG